MYSSTDLKGPAESGCWKQLDYAEERVPSLFPLEYRSYLGQAAHAVLQYCAERRAETEADIRKTATEVGNLLINEGRVFRGHKESPLPAEDVWAGVDVAEAYLLGKGLPYEFSLGELGTAKYWVEQDWTHPTIPARALIDLVTIHEEGDEEYSQRVMTVTDYKSSWQAVPDELGNLQRWMQTVIMYRHAEAEAEGIRPAMPDIIRQSVINLRTWAEYTRDIDINDPDDIAELEEWERRIDSLCMTAHHSKVPGTGKRPASPGVGCLSCAWRHVCEDSDYDIGAKSNPQDVATALAIIEGERSVLIKTLKAADVEKPIKIKGGEVGFREQVRRVMAPGKEQAILLDWFRQAYDDYPADQVPVLTSLLSALKLGKSNLDAFAKALMPERRKGIQQDRDDYVESITVERRFPQFGVWKNE